MGISCFRNSQICIVADLWQLNKLLERGEYHIPTIDKMLSRIYGFTYAMGIELNMGYMILSLNAHDWSNLRIIFLFGIYEYQVLPMGIKPATDIFQARITSSFASMQDNSPMFYIDDVLICSNSFEKHMAILRKVLMQFAEAGLQVIAEKSEWCKQEIVFLGFTITPTWYKPMRSRVKAILAMTPPKNIKELRGFVGCINFIKNHIPKQVDLIRPLTQMTRKGVTFWWGAEQQQAFEKTKAAVLEAVMLTYPDATKPFILYMDASDYAKAISCFSHKLTLPQLNYTITNKELLAVYEGLKFHHNLIYGCEVTVMTDHKNLTHESTQYTSQRILCQRVALDQEYGAKIVYYQGELNTSADGLSCLPFDSTTVNKTTQALFAIESANHDIFPTALKSIASAQKEDAKLNRILNKTSQTDKVGTITIKGAKLRTVNNKIWAPKAIQRQLILWYQENLQHAGSTWLLNTIGIHFGYPGLRKDIENIVRTCDTCQRHKTTGKKNMGRFHSLQLYRTKNPGK